MRLKPPTWLGTALWQGRRTARDGAGAGLAKLVFECPRFAHDLLSLGINVDWCRC